MNARSRNACNMMNTLMPHKFHRHDGIPLGDLKLMGVANRVKRRNRPRVSYEITWQDCGLAASLLTTANGPPP